MLAPLGVFTCTATTLIPFARARSAISSLPIAGQVGYIADTAEFTPKTVQTDELRTALVYEVRVYVDDEENVLRLGMPATVKINL